MFGCLNASNCLSKAISRNVDIGTPSSVNATRTLQKIRRKIVEDHKLNTTHSNTFKQKLQLLFECNNFSWIFQVSCLVNRSVCTWSNHNYYYFYVRISHLNFKGKNQVKCTPIDHMLTGSNDVELFIVCHSRKGIHVFFCYLFSINSI